MQGGWRDWWLDLVHGSSCLGCATPGRVLCPGCQQGLLDVRPARTAPEPCPAGLVRCVSAGEYAGLLRQVVVAHKEHAVHALAAPLAALLADSARTLLAAQPPVAGSSWPTPVLLVPVPSRAAVVRRRGHDPLGTVVRVAARLLRAEGVPAQHLSLLRQCRTVADQAGLDARHRAENLVDSMAVNPAVRDRLAGFLGPIVVLLCDDVITTGSTAREAQRALTDAGIVVGGVITVAATRRRQVIRA